MPRVGKNIYQRKDGRFEGSYIVAYDDSGKAKYASVYGKSYDEVDAKLIELKAEQRARKLKGIETFSEAMQEWINDRRGKISDASVDRYEYTLTKYVLPLIGDENIENITPTRINLIVADLANEEKHGDNAIRGTSLQNIQSMISSVVSFVKNRGKDVPSLESLVHIEKKPSEPLSDTETAKLIRCAKYNRCPEMLGVMLSLYCGIGTGELCALSWDDFDTEKREIFIHNTIYRLRDKSEDARKRTKLEIMEVRKSALRTVVYPEALSGYVEEQYIPGAVFMTGEKNRYMEKKTFSNRLENILELYKLKNLTVRRLIKTYKEGLSDESFLVQAFSQGGTAKLRKAYRDVAAASSKE